MAQTQALTRLKTPGSQELNPIETSQPVSENEAALLNRIGRTAGQTPVALPVDGKVIPNELSLQPASPTIDKTIAAAKPSLFPFPNLAWSVLQVGLKTERRIEDELNHHADQARKMQEKIGDLLELSNQFSAIAGDKKEIEITDKIKTLSEGLKGKGIELLQCNEKKISRERYTELKALIGSQIDNLKTELQKKFTTEIQVKINELNSILDCLKTLEKYSSRLHQTIIANSNTHR